MNFKPLHDKILMSEVNQTAIVGGLITPATVNSFKIGKVVAVGGEAKYVHVGEEVLYKDGAEDISIDGKDYKIIPERGLWLNR